jgi:dTMP kinase
MFLTIEGIDGSGKTTLANRLHQWLQSHDRKVYTPVFEPGITDIGKWVRHITKEGAIPLTPLTETLLFMTARAQFIAEVVRPLFYDGWIVICDRHSDSTLAYQGYGHGVDLGTIRTLNDIATQGMVPALTLLIQVDLDTALTRMRAHGQDDRIERNGREFYERVANGYFEESILGRNVHRIVTLDGNKDFEEVLSDAKNIVGHRLDHGDPLSPLRPPNIEGGRMIIRTPQMADFGGLHTLRWGIDDREIGDTKDASRETEVRHSNMAEVIARLNERINEAIDLEALTGLRKRLEESGQILQLKTSFEQSREEDSAITLTAKIEPRLVLRTPEMKPPRIENLTPPPFPEFDPFKHTMDGNAMDHTLYSVEDDRPINPEDEGDGA